MCAYMHKNPVMHESDDTGWHNVEIVGSRKGAQNHDGETSKQIFTVLSG